MGGAVLHGPRAVGGVSSSTDMILQLILTEFSYHFFNFLSSYLLFTIWLEEIGIELDNIFVGKQKYLGRMKAFCSYHFFL